jgi:hypothetical protein
MKNIDVRDVMPCSAAVPYFGEILPPSSGLKGIPSKKLLAAQVLSLLGI